MIDKQYIGQVLLEKGFRDWFLYLFRVIEDRPFIVEPIHKDLFDACEKITTQEITRLIINLPPRSAKTTLMKYLTVYAITIRPGANIIYTSFSQSLLGEISTGIANILESPIYKAMYPQKLYISDEKLDGIDEFWKDYKLEETKGKQNYYSAKKITTYAGGTLLFASIGAQITGYGCGIRNARKFSGALIIDDPNKPADVLSRTMRTKVFRYYIETLLSRLNSSNIPIINVQQRLHTEDLTGLLLQKYDFELLKKPLIVDGVCQIPSQYDENRLKEIQMDNYMFQAQYQQEPILNGGNIIKRDWFNYYPVDQEYDYKKIVIAADTAIAVKEHSDYSAFLVGGITKNNKLHILDIVHGKWEFPELKERLVNLYNMWQFEKRHTSCSAVYIENKASGQQLIQELKKKTSLPIMSIEVTKDKLTRVQEVLEYIASGLIFLPVNEYYGNNNKLIDECSEFSRDMSHSHDDLVDSLVHLINSTIAHREVSILEAL